MKKSQFSFSRPCLTKCNFETWDGELCNQETTINLELKYGNNPVSDNSAESVLYVAINRDSELSPSTPFHMEIEYWMKSEWESGVSDEMIEEYLNNNARMILLSYARPFITEITAQSQFPPFILPLFDLT